MTEDLQYMLQKKSRNVKILGFITVIIMVIVNLIGQVYIDSHNWFLQGYGWFVWVPIVWNFVSTSWSIAFSRFYLDKSHDFININDLYKAALESNESSLIRRLGRIITIAREVCENAGEDYDQLNFILNTSESGAKTKNAGSLGTSANGVVVINLAFISEDISNKELAGVIAHEIGHAISADSSISMMMKSLTKFFSVYGFISFVFIWTLSGAGVAFGALFFWSIAIPYIFSLNSKAIEELADSYATALGYGDGLISFFKDTIKRNNLNQIIEFFSSVYSDHPSMFDRIVYVKKIMANDQGKVPDRDEFGLWGLFKIATFIVCALYASWQNWNVSTLLWNIPTIFVTASVWLFFADGLLTSINMTVKISDRKNSPIFGIFSLGMLVIFYIAGIHASNYLSTLPGFLIIGNIVKWMWISKPVSMIFEGKSGLMAILSILTTYVSILSAIFLILSLFIKFHF